MTGFKTPFPTLLADVLTHALNEMIRVDGLDSTKKRLQTLEGRSVALCLTGVGIHLIVRGEENRLVVEAMPPALFDGSLVSTSITGTPEALLAMAIPAWSQPNSGVRIEGDAGAAQALEQLMRQLDPDWEALLVERFGVVLGHRFYSLFVGLLETGREVSAVGFEQVSQFVREESGWLVDRADFKVVSERIDELQEGIDRLLVNAKRKGMIE